jgi:uncharacterized protein (TIGR03437 family)
MSVTREYLHSWPRSAFAIIFVAAATLILPVTCHGQGYTITTVAGGGRNFVPGDGGPATSAWLSQPSGLAVDAAGNLFIADAGYDEVRKVSTAGIISTVAGSFSLAPGSLGDGGPAVDAHLGSPGGVAVDAAGNLYIADWGHDRIRKVDASGIITTVAGGGDVNPDDGGPATQATMSPTSVAVDSAGNLYIGDDGNYELRKVTPSGTITTLAPATVAAVALDGAGNLYYADNERNQVRKLLANGVVSTIAGSGSAGYSGDGGPAASAALNAPQGVAVDSLGNVYIADTGNNVVRMVSAAGTIATIAGGGSEGESGYSGPATGAWLQSPLGLTVDSGGRVFMADSWNGLIRMLTPVSGSAPSITPGGVISADAFGAFPSVAPGSWIEIYGTKLASDSRSWTGADFTGDTAPTSLEGTSVTVGGQSAFIDYISPTQVNAQVPSNAGTGPQPVVVTSAGVASAPLTLTVNPEEPGLLAPASFNIGGTQYLAALFSDGTTFVLPPGAIAGVTSRRAQPGDVITLYGIGFGPVTPNVPAGQIVPGKNTLAAPFHVFFGQTEALVQYDGLAPSAVGLYQFNVEVPGIAASDNVSVTFTLGGQPGTQTLYIAVQN